MEITQIDKDNFKVITQAEQSVVINLKAKQAELAKLEAIFAGLKITEEEKNEWAAQELFLRQEIYRKRIQEVQSLINTLKV